MTGRLAEEAAPLAMQHQHLVVVIDLLRVPFGRQHGLQHAVRRADGSAGGLTLVTGDSGIGKTTLAQAADQLEQLRQPSNMNELNKQVFSLLALNRFIAENPFQSTAGPGTFVGNQLRGYGNLIMIKHNEDYISAYAHNDKLMVNNGQSVKIGQQIATMGSSDADSVRLHFQIRYRATAIDPLRYLPQR